MSARRVQCVRRIRHMSSDDVAQVVRCPTGNKVIRRANVSQKGVTLQRHVDGQRSVRCGWTEAGSNVACGGRLLIYTTLVFSSARQHVKGGIENEPTTNKQISRETLCYKRDCSRLCSF